MQDVADLAHVSKQTVSAVINDKPGITEETRARVLAAIKQVNYRVDLAARSLRTGRTHTIALLLTDVSSPVLSKLAAAAEERAYAQHYNLVLYNTHDDQQRELFYVDSILQRSVDGVIFVSARDESLALTRLQASGIPTVVVDRVAKSYDGPAVVLDNARAGQLAAEHLAALGHCRFAHVGGPDHVHIERERLAGFQAVLTANGLSAALPAPCCEQMPDWRLESGYAGMRRLLDRTTRNGQQPPFTAVFCAGDLLAIGALHALDERGLHVPEDVSVIGIDDIDLAAYFSPPLTTVSQSIAVMGSLAAEMLLGMLAGQEPEPPRRVIEPQLIVRRSTAAPRGE